MSSFIPYGRQNIEDDDLREVERILRSDYLTTGPEVAKLEEEASLYSESTYALAVSSGTAALHCALYGAGIQEGDEVIVSSLTFAASSNAVLYVGGKPIFADVDEETLLIDPKDVEEKISSKTKAILAVDYAGQPCDYEALSALGKKHKLKIISDSCHSLGSRYQGKRIGQWADLAAYSFHPVKLITSGEGGMVVCNDEAMIRKMRSFRNHGIDLDHRERSEKATYYYEMGDLGYNYRLTDFQSALARNQLKKLNKWRLRREEIAKDYDLFFQNIEGIEPLKRDSSSEHSHHLYVVQIQEEKLGRSRDEIYQELRKEGIGANVHYLPVFLHPYYQKLGYSKELCPRARKAYQRILSLPLFSQLKKEELERVKDAFLKIL